MIEPSLEGVYKKINEEELQSVERDNEPDFSTEKIQVKGLFQKKSAREKLTTVEAGLQLTKVIVGSGILFMPKSFQAVGIWQGILWTVIIGLLNVKSNEMLIQASRYWCEVNKIEECNYGETARLTLLKYSKRSAWWGSFTISTLLVVCTHSVGMLYVLIVAKNMQEVLASLKGPMWPLRAFVAIQIPFHLWADTVPTLRKITPMTVIALIALWTGYCLTTYSILYDIFTKGVQVTSPWTSMTQLPSFLSVSVIAVSGAIALTTIENNMKVPKHFIGCPSVSCVVVIFVSAFYTLYGITGYLAYGEDTKGPITSNFELSNVVGIVLKISLLVGILLSCPVILFTPLNVVTNAVKHRLGGKPWMPRAFKCLQVMLMLVLPLITAEIAPVLQIMVIPMAILQFVLPPIIDSVLFSDIRPLRSRYFSLITNTVVAAFGLGFAILGFYTAIHDLIYTQDIIV